MAVVRRSDTNGIDAVRHKSLNRVFAREAGEVSDATGRALLVVFCPFSGPAGHGRQLNIDKAEVAAIEAFGVQLLEQPPIGVVKDHSQADHTGTEMMMRKVRSSHGG